MTPLHRLLQVVLAGALTIGPPAASLALVAPVEARYAPKSTQPGSLILGIDDFTLPYIRLIFEARTRRLAAAPDPMRGLLMKRELEARPLNINDVARETLAIVRPFCTTKGGSKGMGVGLAIARGIVNAHAGRIGALNNPQGGAAVWFTVPSSPEVPS